MNIPRSFIHEPSMNKTDISECFINGFEKLTLCSIGGIHFLYIIQKYSKQVLVHRGACTAK